MNLSLVEIFHPHLRSHGLNNLHWRSRMNQYLTMNSSTSTRNLSLSTTKYNSNSNKKYTHTLLLPKTEFPLRIPAINKLEHEVTLAKKLQFEQLYSLQRLWRRDQTEYILHDGPPYANGEPHIGHAVNKILKDITNRYKLLRGYRINYKPGWDCHGLPIEMKAMKDSLKNTPLEIRSEAREIANSAILKQKEAFKRWGIMGEWEDCYHTTDEKYIKTQLQIFKKLYDKNLVFRDLKPVYWSPSSKTALAEAELDYNPRHESPSIILGLDMELNLQNFISHIGGPPGTTTLSETPSLSSPISSNVLQAVIWTTTPWSLPTNSAIAYNKNEKYSLVYRINNYTKEREYFILGSSLVENFRIKIDLDLRTVLEFSGSQLENLKYKHPWFKDRICGFLHSDHVTMEKGTGLVHIAPAHGSDDYVLALKHKLDITCYVDSGGCFDSQIEILKNLPVLTGGNNTVIKKLDANILLKEKYIHSYPYDWRTKKPVIIKTSMQWFMDTNKLKQLALDSLDKVGIYPKNTQNGMLAQVKQRPYWCISRQRCWGVPIPVLYHKETGEPLINDIIVDRLCDLIDQRGNIDDWWTVSPSMLIQDDVLGAKYEKGKDIFDIWFDSGISWHIFGDNIVDLYMEGQDQFIGWFQSSLLASIAFRDVAPYKNIFVHGFVVDENNQKMSKSIGNVVHPSLITDGDGSPTNRPFGSDVLRWWVATQGGVDGSNIHFSSSLLKSSEECIQKLRSVLRFLISYVNEDIIDELDIDNVTYDELMYVDQYMLAKLVGFQNQITQCYDEFSYHRVMMKTLHFATTEISSQYFTWIKDRIYCDLKNSQSRRSAIFVLNQIYLTLIKTLGPVLPYLTEETYSHYSSVEESLFKYTWFEREKSWENANVTEMIDLALDIRTSVNQILGDHDPKQIWVEIICNQKNYKILQVLHPDECTSELCDILQVSGINLICNDQVIFTNSPFGVSHSLIGFSIGVSKTEKSQCIRCRYFCCIEGTILCSRCQSVIKRIEQQQQQQKDTSDVKTIESTVGTENQSGTTTTTSIDKSILSKSIEESRVVQAGTTQIQNEKKI